MVQIPRLSIIRCLDARDELSGDEWEVVGVGELRG